MRIGVLVGVGAPTKKYEDCCPRRGWCFYKKNLGSWYFLLVGVGKSIDCNIGINRRKRFPGFLPSRFLRKTLGVLVINGACSWCFIIDDYMNG